MCPAAARTTASSAHQQVFRWDIVPLGQRLSQLPGLRVWVDVGEGHGAQSCQHLWRRPIRVFIRIQLHNILCFPPQPLGQDLKGLNGRVGLELEQVRANEVLGPDD